VSIRITVDVRGMLSPVRDQEVRPTCLSFATSTAHEYSRGSLVPLSPEYLHFFATSGGASVGVRFPDIATALRDEGQSLELDCPYSPSALPAGWSPPVGLQVYRRGTEAVNAHPDNVESLLLAGHVPVLGLSLPGPFFNPVAPWVISAQGPVRGHHAVVAVGVGSYSGARLFLIRNSWGASWGDGGHAWLDDNFLCQHLRAVMTVTHEVTL